MSRARIRLASCARSLRDSLALSPLDGDGGPPCGRPAAGEMPATVGATGGEVVTILVVLLTVTLATVVPSFGISRMKHLLEVIPLHLN